MAPQQPATPARTPAPRRQRRPTRPSGTQSPARTLFPGASHDHAGRAGVRGVVTFLIDVAGYNHATSEPRRPPTGAITRWSARDDLWHVAWLEENLESRGFEPAHGEATSFAVKAMGGPRMTPR